MALDYRAGAAIMLVTSANALAYNVIHNAMIKMTSAVTTTVIGEAKIVGLFILSALLLGESCLVPLSIPRQPLIGVLSDPPLHMKLNRRLQRNP